VVSNWKRSTFDVQTLAAISKYFEVKRISRRAKSHFFNSNLANVFTIVIKLQYSSYYHSPLERDWNAAYKRELLDMSMARCRMTIRESGVLTFLVLLLLVTASRQVDLLRFQVLIMSCRAWIWTLGMHRFDMRQKIFLMGRL
jgi:hypothetical protein